MYGLMPSRKIAVIAMRDRVRIICPTSSTWRRPKRRSASRPAAEPITEATPVKTLRMIEACESKPAAISTFGA